MASVEPETPKASRGWGLRVLGERRKLPSGCRGSVPAKNDFTAFYACQNACRSRLWTTLIFSLYATRKLTSFTADRWLRKNAFAQWIGSDPLRQPRQLRRYCLQFMRWHVDKNRFREKFWDINAILQFDCCFVCTWQVSCRAVATLRHQDRYSSSRPVSL